MAAVTPAVLHQTTACASSPRYRLLRGSAALRPPAPRATLLGHSSLKYRLSRRTSDERVEGSANGGSLARPVTASYNSSPRRHNISASREAIEPANAGGDSIAAEVASYPDAEDTDGVASSRRRPSPLERGGTLRGSAAEGKDPSKAAFGLGRSAAAAYGEKFSDPRWKNGTWDLDAFTEEGKVNWDIVIDAEVVRRKWLEDNPESSTNDDPVLFDSSQIPWWAWVRRFHLPEAEKLNGRAAMVGYGLGYIVDAATGTGLVDQQSSFLGKFLIFFVVSGILLIRRNEDIVNLKNLVDEWTFYDKQWQATWKNDNTRSKKNGKK